MNAWDLIGNELVKATRWDWSFLDSGIIWPVVLAAGICILLAAMDPDRQLEDRYEHGSHEESATTKRRGQGV
jgi:hypothetical protein